jgi:acyl-CoA thioester hydrolase
MPDPDKQQKPHFHFHLSMQVRFRDVDAMGHVNHAVYFSYFEMARCEYWMSLLKRKRLNEIDFIVVRAECDYRRATEYGGWLDVFAAVTEIRNSSFVMAYEIRERGTRRVVATGSTIQALFDYPRHRTRAIPLSLRQKIEKFEGHKLSD